MKRIVISFCTLIILSACVSNPSSKSIGYGPFPGPVAVPSISFAPRNYICYRTKDSICVDGNIEEKEWSHAPWSELFTDIEGDLKPMPLYDTRIKLLWDEQYLYIAAEIDEPNIWATLRQRDTVVYYDNDFEVFIDPDGDTHGYYEFEMNAFNTVWDLLLTSPYRDFGHVIDAWDIDGLLSAVKIYGTINDPSDTDEKWTIELAFPFKVLSEWGNMPVNGTQWRVNFSRVNWKTKVINGRYVKMTDPASGKALPEYNWLWTPQGVINVHYPEMWGFLQFSSDDGTGQRVKFNMNPDENIKWDLRRLYYAQRAYSAAKRCYAADAGLLSDYGYTPAGLKPKILVTMSGYEASLPAVSHKGYIFINHQGLTWSVFR